MTEYYLLSQEQSANSSKIVQIFFSWSPQNSEEAARHGMSSTRKFYSTLGHLKLSTVPSYDGAGIISQWILVWEVGKSPQSTKVRRTACFQP